jgi:propanol-preferring alcohol dehydrogenase
VGIQGVQLAEAMGFRPIVVDTGSDREKLAKSLGAEHFVDFKSEKHVDQVLKLADGIGAHAVFVTAPQSYGNSLAYLGNRVGGQVMCIALPAAGTNLVRYCPRP